MTKQEAAQFLGISERTLIRKVNAGELAQPTYHKAMGATAAVVDYDRKDLERYKTENANRTVERPKVALASRAPAQPAAIHDALNLAQLSELLTEGITRALEATQSRAAVVSTATLTGQAAVSLDDAARVSHFPKSLLRRAIKDGQLKALRLGNGWNIRCADLDRYISDLEYDGKQAKNKK